jgi:short-subunit dehydrogenase
MNYYSYYKLILNTYATELSRRLNRDNLEVVVDIICPGPVNSNIAREAPWILHKLLKMIFFLAFKSPQKAARAVIYMALSKDYQNRSNEYLHMFIPKRMDEKCYNPQEGSKLWEHSMRLCQRVNTPPSPQVSDSALGISPATLG